MTTLIVDYGMCNLGSVRRAVEECGGTPCVSPDVADLEKATSVILPGVGAFADGMRNLEAAGWVEPLRALALQGKIPLLGICLGMQLLAEHGTEGGGRAGLGVIPGTVTRLEPHLPGDRVPHIGWNEVARAGAADPGLLQGIPDGVDFYFVHSFAFRCERLENVVATTPYCAGFTSVVNRGAVWGVQFHPEKSATAGFRLLRNFLERR